MSTAKLIQDGEQAYASGEWNTALKLFQEALTDLETRGQKNQALAMTVNNLAMTYRAMGRHEDAEPLLKGCVPISKEVLGDHHPDVAIAINNLAALYCDQGRYDLAEASYLEALAIHSRLKPEGHPNYSIFLKGLYQTYIGLERQDMINALEAQLMDIGISPEGLETEVIQSSPVDREPPSNPPPPTASIG